MLSVLLDVVFPLAVGATVARKLPAIVVTIVLGSVVFWWPQNDTGDDWRPIVYPFALAWLGGLAFAGVLLRSFIHRSP